MPALLPHTDTQSTDVIAYSTIEYIYPPVLLYVMK